MEIATYINLAFFIGFLGIFIWVCGVKAWCSVAVVATIAAIYVNIDDIFKTINPEYNIIIRVLFLFGVSYLTIITLCVGFNQINPIMSSSNVAKNAAINSIILVPIVVLILLSLYEIGDDLIGLFGNTIGYWVLLLYPDFNDTMKQIKNGDIPSLPIDYSFIITLFKNASDIDKYLINTPTPVSEPSIIYNLLKNTNINDNVQKLKDFVQIKTMIGHLVWISFASVSSVVMTLSNRRFYL